MAMDVSSKKGPKSDINVTPLIDVVLVLLIIFMVLTPAMLKHLTAAVPKKVEDATTALSEEAIVIEYTDTRQVRINGEAVLPEALADRLSERLQADRRKVVFFQAEDEAPYGEVVHIMDIARGAGARTLAVVTR